jgi:DNA-binding IclR family transcriptional regulator
MRSADASVVKSAARTLEIFEYFDSVRRPASIHEVAQALGYPHSSTAALLRSLSDLGYLEYAVVDKTFFPSIRVSLLGHWVGEEMVSVRGIQHQMRAVADTTGMTVVLGSINDGYCQYVRVIEANAPIRYHLKAGDRRCLARSTLGHVLLGEAPPDNRHGLILRALATWDGPDAAPAADIIEKRAAQTFARGYAFNVGLVTPHAAMLAVPVRPGYGVRPLALAVAAAEPFFQGRRAEIVEILRNALSHLAPTDRASA